MLRFKNLCSQCWKKRKTLLHTMLHSDFQQYKTDTRKASASHNNCRNRNMANKATTSQQCPRDTMELKLEDSTNITGSDLAKSETTYLAVITVLLGVLMRPCSAHRTSSVTWQNTGYRNRNGCISLFPDTFGKLSWQMQWSCLKTLACHP